MAVAEAPKLPPIRLDLQVVPQYFGGPICYVVKDPVTSNYFRLGEVEYVVLKCFQEGKDVDETREDVKRRTGAEISVREIHRFVEQLKGANLLKSKGMADVPALVRQSNLRRKRKFKQAISNYLFVTIPVWDPDRLLNRLLPWVRFFFTPWFLAIWSARGLVRRFLPEDARVVCIGPTTRAAAESAGLRVDAEATTRDLAGLIGALRALTAGSEPER